MPIQESLEHHLMYQNLHSQGFEALQHHPEYQNTLPATDPGTMGQEPISANDCCCTLRPMMDSIREVSCVTTMFNSFVNKARPFSFCSESKEVVILLECN